MKKYALILAAVLTVSAPFLYREHLIAGLKRPVLGTAVDPDSVRFRQVRILSDWTREGSMLCGEVNARNRAGGYEGYQKFIVMGDRLVNAGNAGLVDAMCSVLDDPTPWWYVPQ